jgi:hypothetical protein
MFNNYISQRPRIYAGREIEFRLLVTVAKFIIKSSLLLHYRSIKSFQPGTIAETCTTAHC